MTFAGQDGARLGCRVFHAKNQPDGDTPVHPRWRGEQGSLAMGYNWEPGSSPLARGTVHAMPNKSGILTVHPRWRGEQGRHQDYQLDENGSSPLARGTDRAGAGGASARRFIPAGAGNRSGAQQR